MGKKNKLREAEFTANEERTFDTLRNHASQKKVKDGIVLSDVMFPTINTNHNNWIKEPNTWINNHKTKDIDTLRRSLIRYVFAKYTAPKFLEKVWLPTTTTDKFYKRDTETWIEDRRDTDNPQVRFVPWYLTVAQGGSLYKEHTKGILSKKETHIFLKAPPKFSVIQNIWWSKAFSESDNIGIAGRVAESNLIRKSYENEFWISVLRFFVRFPTNIHEMNDLLDFFSYMHNENEHYTLKGRSIESVRERCEEWHRFLNKQQNMNGKTWVGNTEIPDWTYIQGKDAKKIVWSITQIKNGKDLLKEGQAMRHCVVAYKNPCIKGTCTIWSLTSTDYAGTTKRNLTLELSKNHIIYQAKGLANRSPRPNENNIVNRWCQEYNIQYKNYW